MPGPIQGTFPSVYTLPELTGNSQFTLVGGVLWLISESEDFVVSVTSVTPTAGGANYLGTITGGAGNALVGITFTVTGFANPNNNGTFICTESTATLLILANFSSVSETPGTAGTASYPIDFAWYYSMDYGISWTKAGDYVFPNENFVSFDPAVCNDGTLIHFIGSRTAYNGSPASGAPNGKIEVVKFTLNPSLSPGPPTLSGPYLITSPGEEVGSDYDIVSLINGDTFAVLDVITPDVQEVMRGYEITPSGVVSGTHDILTSPPRAGLTFGSLSLITPDGVNLEVYFEQHPKILTFTDMAVQIGYITRFGAWDPAPLILRTITCRQVSTKLTVIRPTSNPLQRYFSFTYYTQNRAGLSGNMLLGYLPNINVVTSWTFHDYLGIPTASLVEPTLTVGTTSGNVVLAYITRDLTVNQNGSVGVFNLNTTTWALTNRPDFRSTPRATWLRGTKDTMPDNVPWVFLGETLAGVISIYSGFNVPPVAVLTPISLIAYRNQTFAFNASGSFDLNQDPIQYEWSITYTSWQANHTYNLNDQIIDPNNNVQVITTPGMSSNSIPPFNATLGGNTSDFTAVWTNTGSVAGVSFTPTYPPLSTNPIATLTVPNSVGPDKITATVTVGVVDIDSLGNPIHFPPVGAAVATSAVTIPFVPPPSISFPVNPITAARNSTVALSPVIVVDPNTFPTYAWVQLSGTPVSTGATTGTILVIQTNGVNINGEALVFQFTVNDGINPAVTSTVTVNVNAYVFATFDNLRLTRSNFTVDGTTPATIAQRNTPQIWSTPQESALFTNLTSIKRSSTLTGDDRFIAISASSILVFQYVSNTSYVLLRRLLVPTTNAGVSIIDAYHTEQDQTLVLTSNGLLYRYSTAPLLNTDNPDTVINLSALTTFTFNRILATPTFANTKVLLLSGQLGMILLQVNSTTLAIESLLVVTTESNLVYGADNVQFVRYSNVETIRTGKVLVGTIGPDGATYETLIDLSHRIVLGTWDKSKLKNQIVASGEILFEQFSGYVGSPQAPFLNPILTDSNYAGLLSWTQERPDLVQSYVISVSVNFGPFTTLAVIGNGLIENYITVPLDDTKTYEFSLHSVTADGVSPQSNIQTLLAIPATPSAVLTIPSVSTNFQLPRIIQHAQDVFTGVTSDSISLPNPVQIGNMILFAHTLVGTTPFITDNNGAAYTNIEGLLFSTTNLVNGPLTVKYNLSGSPPTPSFTNGPVYLFEISNSNAALTNGEEANSSGTLFTTNYATSSPNSIEVLHVITSGVLTANPFTTSMGIGIPPQGGFFNLGEVDQEFVGQYTNTFTQAGSGNWAVVAANVPSSINGTANLIWTQAHQENITGYLVQQQINAGPFLTIATITNPAITSYNAPLSPVLLNSGVISTTFTYQIVTTLKAGLGNTAPSNQVEVDFPLQATPLTLTTIDQVPFGVDLNTVGLIVGAGNEPYTFSLLSGTLPSGFTISPAGILGGTTTMDGTFPVIVQIQDTLGVAIDVFLQVVVQSDLVNGQVFEINGAGTGNIYSINGAPLGTTIYPLTSVNNAASAGSPPITTTTYNGTFPPVLPRLPNGILISGFVNGVNNGTFTIVSNTTTTVTVNNSSGIAETVAAMATVTFIA